MPQIIGNKKGHIMPEGKGYPRGRKQSSTTVVNPAPSKKTSVKRKGKRK